MILIIKKIRTGRLRFGTAALILVLGVFISSAALANEVYRPSSWASAKIAIAGKAGLMPEDFNSRPFTANITRRDFCELLVNSCRIFAYPLPQLQEDHPFTDTRDKSAEYAFLLGLTSGTAAGVFSPDLPLTREMAVVMLGKLRLLFQPEDGLMDDQEAGKILREYAKDSAALSDWAKVHMADAYARGIIAGTDVNILSPQKNVTREQAVIFALNTLAYSDDSRLRTAGVSECVLPAPSGIYIAEYYKHSGLIFTWGEIPAASGYEVRIFKNGMLVYAARTKENNLYLGTSTRRGGEPPNEDNPFGKERQPVRALLEVVPLDKSGRLSVFSLRKEFTVGQDDDHLYGTITSRSKVLYKSAAEALPHMKNVEVAVWQLSDGGVKKTGFITLTVHKDVADDVRGIFAEIYNGREKFPIKSCYGYSYRGSSQHSSGLAIDINPDENYFIGPNGAIKSGKLWQPGVNPYSILPDGDVVRAFKKYGWHWSPEMHWSSGADYMHFSLSGT